MLDNANVINTLLENSCANYEDFQEYEKWEVEVERPYRRQGHPIDDLPPYYPGWKIFRIDLCCTAFEIIARRSSPSGTYEIREMKQVD